MASPSSTCVIPATPTCRCSCAQLSSGNEPVVLNGEVDWVYEEELDTRSNYFWSPDSKNIAYLQMNETEVPQYPLTDWIPVHAAVEWQRYPQPGDPNPDVRVGVVSASGGKTVWIKLPIQPGDDYIPRFGWVDNKTVWVETLTPRSQAPQHLSSPTPTAAMRIRCSRSATKSSSTKITTSRSATGTSCSPTGPTATTISISTATTRRIRSAAAAKLERQLTSGDFEVGEVYRVDSAHKVVDYASNEGNPLEQQIWQVNFDGERKQLTPAPDFTTAISLPTAAHLSTSQSTRMDPPTLQPVPGRRHQLPRLLADARARAYHLRAPEQLEVKATTAPRSMQRCCCLRARPAPPACRSS